MQKVKWALACLVVLIAALAGCAKHGGSGADIPRVTVSPGTSPIDRWAGWPAQGTQPGGPRPQFAVIVTCASQSVPYGEIYYANGAIGEPSDYVEVQPGMSSNGHSCLLNWRLRRPDVEVIGLAAMPHSVWQRGGAPLIVNKNGYFALLITAKAAGGNPPAIPLDANGTPTPPRPQFN